MKKHVLQAAFLAAGLAAAPVMATDAKSACDDLASYTVSQLAFDDMPVADAFASTVAGTPFKVVGSGSSARIAASNVSGPIPAVLNRLARAGGVSWKQTGCQIALSRQDGGQAAASGLTWQVKLSDELISKAVIRWGRDAGWAVVWDSPKDFRVDAEASFGGTFITAVERLMDSLASSDSPVYATEHPNNVLVIQRYTGQTSELTAR